MLERELHLRDEYLRADLLKCGTVCDCACKRCEKLAHARSLHMVFQPFLDAHPPKLMRFQHHEHRQQAAELQFVGSIQQIGAHQRERISGKEMWLTLM